MIRCKIGSMCKRCCTDCKANDSVKYERCKIKCLNTPDKCKCEIRTGADAKGR